MSRIPSFGLGKRMGVPPSSPNSSTSNGGTSGLVKTIRAGSIQNISPLEIPQIPNSSEDLGLDTGFIDTDEIATTSSLSVGGIDSIKVCVRIRPMIRDDKDASEILAWSWDKKSIYQNKFTGKSGHSPSHKPPENASVPTYMFDHIFIPEDTNDIIYDSVIRGLVSNCMEGYHGSVFSYGQTSSGKTFTMNGTSKQPGVIPLAVYDCFTLIEEYTDREFLFRATYLEVYNEQVKDLLNPDPIASGNIKIQHDPRAGTVISGIREQVVANAQQVMALLQGGESHRHVGSTNMNEKSSRAHTIFRMKVESKERFANTSVRISTLNLIDLAGSENARMTGSTGDRAKEAKFINQSLLTLSLIIQRLSEESSTAKRQHLPYRDSKLTRILQEPLSGNALIAIICTMSPALRCADESNNTLRFATRAKKVKVAAATVNEDVDDKALLQAYRREIEQLKAKLAEQESSVPMTQMVRSIDPDEEEKREKLLQMIDDMERFIVKADVTVIHDHPTKMLAVDTSTLNLPGALSSPGMLHRSRRHSLDSQNSTSRSGSLVPSFMPTPPQSPGGAQTKVPSFEFHQRSRPFRGEEVLTDHEGNSASQTFSPSRSIPTANPMRFMNDAETGAEEEGGGDDLSVERGFFEAQPVRRTSALAHHQHHSPEALQRSTSKGPVLGALGGMRYTPEKRRSYVATVVGGEHILQGVAQMLQSLKAQVSRVSLSPPPHQHKGQSATHEQIENLKLDIKLKDADSRFLQDELDKKERIMDELTEGLKEVALTHEQWAQDLMEAQMAYEQQARECDELRSRIAHLEDQTREIGRLREQVLETDRLKARVQILESVLRRRDLQLLEIAGGRTPNVEDAMDVRDAGEEPPTADSSREIEEVEGDDPLLCEN